ncbi:unnamed protein product [Cyprideis torosa]|uniref:phenylalanine--tRNA ligase n=1 Tax=Cyprideis torosa TaxID=163714 RepID=A0A7R8WDR4_9CRUS|nr:unnamed protein product [Cyprideis torosa]CAG0894991.1 unnamed protein product [Cyprideis torosa]
MASEIGEKLLQELSKVESVNSLEAAQKYGIDHQKIVGAIKSLQSLGEVVNAELQSRRILQLTGEGEEIAHNGSYEFIVFQAIPEEGIPQAKLLQMSPKAKIGFSKAMSSGWIVVDKSGAQGPVVKRKHGSGPTVDVTSDVLKRIKTGEWQPEDGVKAELKKRKLLIEGDQKYYIISKGPEFTMSVSKPETDLTPEMIATGSWKQKTFKPYNFEALGMPRIQGHLHPLMKVRRDFRQIFLEMGFSEMKTNNYVESSFWNFDAVFQPQQHPARDAQDTFFIADPETATVFPEDYVERTKRVHSIGDFGSIGYGYDWKFEEAKKNVLRTHTTAVSARLLYRLAQEQKESGYFKPCKYFSIDRVFRNETLDATHLAEFYQIEGVVADYGMTLGVLMGIMTEFFGKLGMKELRFKPTSNPYTEPSMEVFSYHEGLEKWVEIGNSGLFRPEMLRPMGIPEGVGILGWGLSLERPTMILYGYNNIRDLVGPRIDLHMVQKNPICRLDKNAPRAHQTAPSTANSVSSIRDRQETLLTTLNAMNERLNLLFERTKLRITLLNPTPLLNSLNQILFSIPFETDPGADVSCPSARSGEHLLKGETTVARLLWRSYEAQAGSSSIWRYEKDTPIQIQTEVDFVLDNYPASMEAVVSKLGSKDQNGRGIFGERILTALDLMASIVLREKRPVWSSWVQEHVKPL